MQENYITIHMWTTFVKEVMSLASVSVKVWGPYACFTRPENKVERVSYDVMTASAAWGVLEKIYLKPEFQWQWTRFIF